MKRTFSGFLKAYCAELSGVRTVSMRKLAAAADSDTPRVAEPLFCLAVEEGKVDYLMKASVGTWMEGEWERLAKRARRYKSARSWLSKCESVPERYKKVLAAFESQGDLLRADRRMNALMRERTLKALGESGMTRYRLAKEADVNKGNLYAYLAGDDSKVSRESARKIMRCAEGQAR